MQPANVAVGIGVGLGVGGFVVGEGVGGVGIIVGAGVAGASDTTTLPPVHRHSKPDAGSLWSPVPPALIFMPYLFAVGLFGQ